MKNLLYYPNIVIPMEQVKQSLLYCDQISSILPEYSELNNFITYEDKDSIKTLEYLQDEGLYNPLHPNEIIIRRTKASLLRICDENYLNEARKRFANIHDTMVTNLWNGKMDDEIRQFFSFNRIGEEQSHYMIVEKQTATLYMSIMAYHYSVLHRGEVSIITNDLNHQNNLFEESPLGLKVLARRIILEGILPIPSDNVSIDDILSFKRARKTELEVLKSSIESMEASLSQARSTEEIENIVHDWSTELKNQSSDLMKMQTKEVFEVAKTSILACTIPLVIGTIWPQYGVQAGLIMDGIIMVKDIVYTDKIWNNPRQILPISYIHNARKEGIITN